MENFGLCNCAEVKTKFHGEGQDLQDARIQLENCERCSASSEKEKEETYMTVRLKYVSLFWENYYQAATRA